MDYLKLLQQFKKEYRTARKEKFETLSPVIRIIAILFMIPFRIGFFFARIAYWLTWFFYKALSAPADYLQTWVKEQKEGLGQAPQTVMYLITLPFIFYQRIILAFNAFSFFFQWFGMMITAYIITLGAVKFQPVITDAKFDEE